VSQATRYIPYSKKTAKRQTLMKSLPLPDYQHKEGEGEEEEERQRPFVTSQESSKAHHWVINNIPSHGKNSERLV
jgi:hypothetical protein